MHKPSAPWETSSERSPEDYYSGWSTEPAQVRTSWPDKGPDGPNITAMVTWSVFLVLFAAVGILINLTISDCRSSCHDIGAEWMMRGEACVCVSPNGTEFAPNTQDPISWD